MFVKVCGMIEQNQVQSLDHLVDFVGFIFYPHSKRFVETVPKSTNAKRVGVFVDELLEQIEAKTDCHQLDLVQLHGDEDPQSCREIRKKIPVIKSFGLDAFFDFKALIPYEGSVDYFLFDTKTPLKGGCGVQFDWSILDRYNLSTPFILSGGINEDSIESIKSIHHPKLVGIDINSRFEISPGNKDIQRIKKFIHELIK
jgi:phosphoribosylanthranilate isomerase